MWIITSYKKNTTSRLVLSSQENILESDNTNGLSVNLWNYFTLLVIVLRRLAPDDV